MKLNGRELGTVLASLRLWQASPQSRLVRMPDGGTFDLAEIATDGGEYEALTADEIDALCERLNR